MVMKVISGGQTGADQAGWRAAKAKGIPTGGWMPKGFETEDGPRPEFAELYGAIEMDTDSYPPRTAANVRDSDGTLWFGSIDSSGYRSTHDAVLKFGRPFAVFESGTSTTYVEVCQWILQNRVETLNVAGHRESKHPGIGERTERILRTAFHRLIH